MPARLPTSPLQPSTSFTACVRCALQSTPVRSVWVLSLAALAVWALAGCTSTKPPANVEPVQPFSLQRYSGMWYEIARLDHSFERGMTDVSASYSAQDDGSVRVINRGFVPKDGRWSEIEGKALFNGAPTTGSLKVSFFGPFYGGYHIAALDADYRWALVVGPNTGYAWILAREKTLPPETRAALLQRAKALGIDTQALIWVEHSRTDPQAAQK